MSILTMSYTIPCDENSLSDEQLPTTTYPETANEPKLPLSDAHKAEYDTYKRIDTHIRMMKNNFHYSCWAVCNLTLASSALSWSKQNFDNSLETSNWVSILIAENGRTSYLAELEAIWLTAVENSYSMYDSVQADIEDKAPNAILPTPLPLPR